MGYLVYIFALTTVVLGNTKELTFNQGVDKFLDIAVNINQFLFWVILAIWVFWMAFIVVSLLTKSKLALGCTTVFFTVLPILQLFMWRMSIGLANSFDPSGITDPTKFWALVALTVLLGLG